MKKKETIIITDNLSPSSFYRLNQKFYDRAEMPD